MPSHARQVDARDVVVGHPLHPPDAVGGAGGSAAAAASAPAPLRRGSRRLRRHGRGAAGARRSVMSARHIRIRFPTAPGRLGPARRSCRACRQRPCSSAPRRSAGPSASGDAALAWSTYLIGAFFALGLGVFGVAWLAILYLAGGDWSVTMRRIPEAMTAWLLPGRRAHDARRRSARTRSTTGRTPRPWPPTRCSRTRRRS